MQVYNCDETGVSIVYKPGKVIAELGHYNVYAITSAERGKTHTIVSCVSASGYNLPPMMNQCLKISKWEPYQTLCLQTVKMDGLTKIFSCSGSIFFLHNIPPT